VAFQDGPGALQHLGLVEQDAVGGRGDLQDGREQGAGPAGDVGDGSGCRPVQHRHAGKRQRLGPLDHRLVEQGLLVGMGGQVLPVGHAQHPGRGRPAGPQRLGQPVGDVGVPDGGEGGLERGRVVPAQQPAPVGQADPVTVEGHDLVVGDQPQHPRQRVLVGADGRGQLRQRQRPGGQALGDLQPRDGAQAMPQQPEVEHLDQGLPVGRRVPSHVRSFRPRPGARYTAGGTPEGGRVVPPGANLLSTT
jgi:hypothetical protein